MPPPTVWLAPPSPAGKPGQRTDDPPGPLLPRWAIDRVRREFTQHGPRRAPVPLLCLDVQDTRLGMDAHTYVRASKNADIRRGAPVLLAQLPHRVPFDGPSDRLPGFFYRTYRLLSDSTGMLLVACRQHHEAGGELIDPCGQVVAAARGAGFVYRQHILVVHAFAHDGRLHPTPDAPPPHTQGATWRHRTIHTDLLVFTPA